MYFGAGEAGITPMFLAWATASMGVIGTLVRSLEEDWICTGKSLITH